MRKYLFCILINPLFWNSTAPFHSTKDRKVGEALNAFPGPGDYAQRVTKIVPKVQDKMHNAFTTKVCYLFISFSLSFIIDRLRDFVPQHLVLDW